MDRIQNTFYVYPKSVVVVSLFTQHELLCPFYNLAHAKLFL